jgi:hypothetical protein
MSDFLSHLIGRSFTDAPAIQPRLPSLFETAANEFFDEAQSSMLAIGTPEKIASTHATASRLKSSPIGETAPTESIADVSHARVEERLPKPHALAHEDAPMIAQPLRHSVEAAAVRKLEIETKKIIVPVDSFRDGKKDAGEKKRVSEGFSEPRSLQRRKDFSPIKEGSSTSPPIIRVTIGRVEVRAVHSPAPAPKAGKPAPPKLSLEDYLHRRERGSR